MVCSDAEEIVSFFKDSDNPLDMEHDSGDVTYTEQFEFDLVSQKLNASFCANPVLELFNALENLQPEIKFDQHYNFSPCDPNDGCPKRCDGHRCGAEIDEDFHLIASLTKLDLDAGRLVASYSVDDNTHL